MHKKPRTHAIAALAMAWPNLARAHSGAAALGHPSSVGGLEAV